MPEKGTTASVKKAGKQEEFEGMTPSDRKIQAIEDLADELVKLEDEKKLASDKANEANENLVAEMKRRDRTHYNRPTWGSVTLKDTKTTAKVDKKAGSGSDE